MTSTMPAHQQHHHHLPQHHPSHPPLLENTRRPPPTRYLAQLHIQLPTRTTAAATAAKGEGTYKVRPYLFLLFYLLMNTSRAPHVRTSRSKKRGVFVFAFRAGSHTADDDDQGDHSCSCSCHTDTTRRGIPLLVVFLSTQTQREGVSPFSACF